jgi:hypothetical protein
MTSNVNTKPDGLPSLQADSALAAKGNSQPASVPISLYREIASELQANRTTLQSLKTANQNLVQQNQQLRLEIERVVQSALHLRQVADVHPSGKGTLETFPSALDGSLRRDAIAFPEGIVPGELEMSPDGPALPFPKPPEKLLFTEEGQPNRVAQSDVTTEVNTGWLILVILMIILTAFGTGFLIVRPLLPSR